MKCALHRMVPGARLSPITIRVHGPPHSGTTISKSERLTELGRTNRPSHICPPSTSSQKIISAAAELSTLVVCHMQKSQCRTLQYVMTLLLLWTTPHRLPPPRTGARPCPWSTWLKSFLMPKMTSSFPLSFPSCMTSPCWHGACDFTSLALCPETQPLPSLTH